MKDEVAADAASLSLNIYFEYQIIFRGKRNEKNSIDFSGAGSSKGWHG